MEILTFDSITLATIIKCVSLMFTGTLSFLSTCLILVFASHSPAKIRDVIFASHRYVWNKSYSPKQVRPGKIIHTLDERQMFALKAFIAKKK